MRMPKISRMRQALSGWQPAHPIVFAHDRTFTQPVVWVTALVMVAFHIGALAALFFFSWKAFLVAMVLWWIAGGLGVGVGYHRLLTHRGYKTPKWMEYFLTICGTLALEGGPIFWVATHRQHHQNTDKEGDPHSPREGGFWAHVGWLLTGQTMHNDSGNLLPYVPELRKDRSRVDQSLALGAHHPAWCGPSRCGGMEVPVVGHLLSHRPRSPLHVAG
jgi:fatty-acid desaturase